MASQDAERAKFVVEKSEFEKQATVIRAGGEAEAAEVLNKAFRQSGSGFVELRRIEAAKEIADSLARAMRREGPTGPIAQSARPEPRAEACL